MTKKTIVVTSGYFNPIHPGHMECFKLARQLGDELWVIVNNDIQAENKRGVKPFQDQDFRMQIVESVRWVDKVILSIDTDISVSKSFEMVFAELSNNQEVGHIIFAKGGDRTSDEIPEGPILKQYNVQIIDGLGAKTHSSRDYIVK